MLDHATPHLFSRQRSGGLLFPCPFEKRSVSARRRAALLLFATSLIFASTASLRASQKNDLEISLVAQRVVAESNGAESLISDAAAEPGDTLQYTASYRNKSTGTLSRLAPTLPIPTGTEYILDHTKSGPTEGSLDGKTFERFPIHRTKKLADGVEVVVEVPAKAIRAFALAGRRARPFRDLRRFRPRPRHFVLLLSTLIRSHELIQPFHP